MLEEVLDAIMIIMFDQRYAHFLRWSLMNCWWFFVGSLETPCWWFKFLVFVLCKPFCQQLSCANVWPAADWFFPDVFDGRTETTSTVNTFHCFKCCYRTTFPASCTQSQPFNQPINQGPTWPSHPAMPWILPTAADGNDRKPLLLSGAAGNDTLLQQLSSQLCLVVSILGYQPAREAGSGIGMRRDVSTAVMPLQK